MRRGVRTGPRTSPRRSRPPAERRVRGYSVAGSGVQGAIDSTGSEDPLVVATSDLHERRRAGVVGQFPALRASAASGNVCVIARRCSESKFRDSASGLAQLLVPATFVRSVTAALGEKCSGHSFRTEGMQRRVLPVLGDDGSFSFRLLTTIPPVDPDRPPFIAQPLDHRVVATVRHHRANWPSNSTQERPSGANPPRRIEDDNCVGPLQAKIERFVIVAVGDPAVARQQTALLHPPLVIRRPDPAWLPIMEVEMDQR